MAAAILIVDDEPVQRRLLQAAVTKFGYETVVCASGEEALAAVASPGSAQIRAVVLDLIMPGMDGLAVLDAMRTRRIDTPVVVQTARGGVETAVAAMRAGAFDFVVKPAAPERLKLALANAIKVEGQEERVRRAAPSSASAFSFRDIVTRSPAMERVVRLAEKAAASDIPVLVEGESGVGKELIARAVQNAGARRRKPFVTVNCGAIPKNLVESVLFGHEKGAFTGATDKHTGKFVEAHAGTLFLDEIGDLPLDVQVKLLRAVQEGEVDPVGARGTQRVDIRLISATHRDLLDHVRDGRFREDLYYRLNVFPIRVPPLRERKEDIALLVKHFISRFASEAPRVSGISAPALELLEVYDWPGNIRQLENATFRAMVLCEGDVLTTDEFPQIRAQVHGLEAELGRDEEKAAPAPALARSEEPIAARMPSAGAAGVMHTLDERGNVRRLADVEAEMIRYAVEHYRGRMSEVARRLGIGRSTLYRKLRELGLDLREERDGTAGPDDVRKRDSLTDA